MGRQKSEFHWQVAMEVRLAFEDAFPDHQVHGEALERICHALLKLSPPPASAGPFSRLEKARTVVGHALDLISPRFVDISAVVRDQIVASTMIASLRGMDLGPSAIANAALRARQRGWHDDDHPHLLVNALLDSRVDFAIHLLRADGGASYEQISQALWYDWSDSLQPVLHSAGVRPQLCGPLGALMKEAARVPVFDELTRSDRRAELSEILARWVPRVDDPWSLSVLYACGPNHIDPEGIVAPAANENPVWEEFLQRRAGR